MKKMGHVAVAATFLVVLAACGKKEEPTALESTPENGTASAASAAGPAETRVLEYADTLSRTMATDKFKSQGGELIGGRLVNNGKAGYLIFGPYVPFQAGNYTVTFNGNVEALSTGKIHLDVVSGKGKVVHGSQDVTTAGEIPSFNIIIAENVSDLEVRVLAPKDSTVAVESYQIVRKN